MSLIYQRIRLGLESSRPLDTSQLFEQRSGLRARIGHGRALRFEVAVLENSTISANVSDLSSLTLVVKPLTAAGVIDSTADSELEKTTSTINTALTQSEWDNDSGATPWHAKFDFADSEEFIEGASPGTDRNLLRALRRGDFSVQGRLDLHGMTQVEAREAMERFLTDSRRAGRRCVLIVHGRGLHSKDQLPVLKAQLKGWLSQKRIGQMALAFASAKPQDGGAGAVYVLLRR